MSCDTVDKLRYHTGYIVICLTDVVANNLKKLNLSSYYYNTVRALYKFL